MSLILSTMNPHYSCPPPPPQKYRTSFEAPESKVEFPTQQRRWDDSEREQLAKTIDQSSLFYWKGPQTALLIKRFQMYYPLEYVMPCSSGTAAIHIAIAAIGTQPGDEIITSPITDVGTVTGILYQQAVPVFADIDPHGYGLDPADVRRKITPRTKAILAVHLAGNPCDLRSLREIADEHNLVLIEDCAQAWGAMYRGRPVGTLGHIGCYSFNDFKHISCGDGGIVASNDERFGPRLQKYGDKAYDRETETRRPEFLAPNYRISEPQSAIAAVQMLRMWELTGRNSELGISLSRKLQGIPGVQTPRVDKSDRCTFWFYMFRLNFHELSCDREAFVEALHAEGIPAKGGYISVPIYKYPLFQNHNFFGGRWPVKELGLTSMDYTMVSCPESEILLSDAVTTPIHKSMDERYIEEVARAVRYVAEYYAKNL